MLSCPTPLVWAATYGQWWAFSTPLVEGLLMMVLIFTRRNSLPLMVDASAAWRPAS